MLETIEQMMRYSNKPMSAMPNAGHPAARGGPQHLSLLARVHGAVRAPLPVGGREDRRRLLRHHAGAHQADPFRSALAAAGAAQARRVSVEEPRTAKAVRRCPRLPVADKSQLGREAGGGQVRVLRRDPAAARRGCVEGNRRRGAVRRARHRLHQRARRPARQRPHERAGHLPAHPAARPASKRSIISAAATATFSASSPSCWARMRPACAI